eukprot:m51a1_g13288 putative eukaryotic translation initiation factor 3 subunit k-like (209) ;mRNA; r:465-1172
MAFLDAMRERFDPAALPALEARVAEQSRGGAYSLDAALSLLQQYQLQPAAARRDLVFAVLARALMNVPAADFAACLCLLPERCAAEEPVATLVALDGLFETAEYARFWEAAEAARAQLEGVSGFFEALRQRVADVLLTVYRRVPAGVAQTALHVGPEALAAMAAQRGWALEGDTLVFPEPPQALSVKAAPACDQLSPDQLSKILAVVH